MNYLNLELKKYLSKLASGQPVPGGGSASALVGTVGISLGIMVAQIILKKKNCSSFDWVNDILSDLKMIKRKIEPVIDRDTIVYSKLAKAYKIKDADRKMKEVGRCLRDSYEIMRNLSVDLILAYELNRDLIPYVAGSVSNDIVLADNFLTSAFWGAFETAAVNVEYMRNTMEKESALCELENIKNEFWRVKNG